MTTNDERDAAKIRGAMSQPDTLTHAEAETLIALLIEAEAMGEDVDDEPSFAPLFQHLDHCEQCLALYEEVSEDYSTTLAEQTSRAPQPLPPLDITPLWTQPTYEFVIRPPAYKRTVLRERSFLYGSAIPRAEEFADISWLTDDQGTTLTVRVLPPYDATRWKIDAMAEDYVGSEHTDDQGIAVFRAVPPDAPVLLSIFDVEK